MEFEARVALLKPVEEPGEGSVVGKPSVWVSDPSREKFKVAVRGSLSGSVQDGWQEKLSTWKYGRTTAWGPDEVAQNGSTKVFRSGVLVSSYSMT